MQRLHEARVAADEIDTLGHMNMRYYSVRAAEGAAALFAKLGLAPAALDAMGARITHRDSFNHFLVEQFEGAPLAVEGGVCDVRADGLSLYLELLNTETGQRAATFILTPTLEALATRAALPFPERALKAADAFRIEIPAHGKPRSLDLAPPRTAVDTREIERRFSAHVFGPAGFEGAPIPETECDAHGFMKIAAAQDIMMAAFTAIMRERQGKAGPPILAGEDGRRIGWAMLENRQYLVATPRAGDRVKTLSAAVKIDRKTQQQRRWTFNADTGELLAVIDGVSLALDLDARRSVEIPPHMRRELEAALAPDFV